MFHDEIDRFFDLKIFDLKYLQTTVDIYSFHVNILFEDIHEIHSQNIQLCRFIIKVIINIFLVF